MATNNIGVLMNGNQTPSSILAVGVAGVSSEPSGRLFKFQCQGVLFCEAFFNLYILKCIQNNYTQVETVRVTSSFAIIRLYVTVVAIFYYWLEGNDKNLKIQRKNCSCFEVSACLD